HHADVAALELFRGRAALPALLLRDARREGVARERAAHVQEGGLAFGVLGVAGLLDLAADHAALADVARGLFGADHVLGEAGERAAAKQQGGDETGGPCGHLSTPVGMLGACRRARPSTR